MNCNRTYTGQTSQYLRKWVRNHVVSIRNDKRETSVLVRHALDETHCFDFENLEKLATEKDFSKRIILEMLPLKMICSLLITDPTFRIYLLSRIILCPEDCILSNYILVY